MDDLDQTIFDTLAAAKRDLAWLDGIKKDQLLYTIGRNTNAMHMIGFIQGFRQSFAQTKHMDTDTFMKKVMTIATEMPIDVDPTKLVFFSGTSQSRAENFVCNHPDYNVIHTTLPGTLLAAFQLFDPDYPLTDDQRYAPWRALSSRLAHRVEGNATAILDLPKKDATFVNYEMPAFLFENKKLLTINETPKQDFWENLTLLGMNAEECAEHKKKIVDKFTFKTS